MAETISNFLVGIGYDYDERGQNEISSGIDNIASKALQLGAVIAGAFGINALTSDFAQATDTLGKFSETFGLIPDEVAGLGRAIQIEGGTFESLISQLESIERLRSLRPDQIGSFFSDAGIVGFDPSIILQAENAAAAFTALGDVIARSSQSRRFQIADVVGLSPAAIRLLSRGSAGVESLSDSFRVARPVTEEMTAAAARFNDQLFIMQTNIGGVSDLISLRLIPGITESVESFNSFVAENRDFINRFAGQSADGVLSFPSPVGGGASADAFLQRINEQSAGITPEDELLTDIGRATARILSLFGNGSAAESLRIEREQGGFTPSGARSINRPIQVNMILDGQVIDSRIIDVNDQLNQRALDDVRTSTGG